MESKTLAGFGIGLVTGVIVGGVIALLYAPQSGTKTRQLIKDKADQAMEVVDTVIEETSGVIDTAREAVSEVSRKGQAAVHSIKS